MLKGATTQKGDAPMKKPSGLSLLVLCLAVATPALAQEPPPPSAAPPPSEPALPPPSQTAPSPATPAKLPEHKLVCCHKVAVFTQIDDQPYLVGVFSLGAGFVLGAGVGLDYTSKPNPMSATDPGRTGNTATRLILYGYYAAINRPTWTTGPEITAAINLSGYGDDPLHVWQVTPAWGIFVAPFKAPLFFGTSLGVQITRVPSADLTTVKLQAAHLRIGWLFH
jgi:hypothetical protein